MDSGLFHNLQGEKIYFKALNIEDAEAIHRYASDEDVSRFIGWSLMKTLKETSDYIEEMIRREAAGTHLYASIVLKPTQEVVGTAMIFNFDWKAKHAEVGYVFHKNHWGRGLCTEAVELMNSFAFEVLKLHKLHARVVAANIGSVRVLEKSGYVLEGRLRDYHFIDEGYYDSLLFGLIKNIRD